MKLGALVSVALMAFAPLVSAQSNGVCNSADLNILKQKAWRYRQFCVYFMSVKRGRSPFSDFSAGRLMQLCKCVVPKAERPAVVRITNQPTQRGWGCVPANLAKLKRHYKEPQGFCDYWQSNARYEERYPAIPGFNYIAVNRACACYTVTSTTPSTTPSTTTSTTSELDATTTSTFDVPTFTTSTTASETTSIVPSLPTTFFTTIALTTSESTTSELPTTSATTASDSTSTDAATTDFPTSTVSDTSSADDSTTTVAPA